ncbi:MAG: response regulator [Desulfobacteraceae bacterium]|nr:response regulator [Desulfobacteraceae bacterium]
MRKKILVIDNNYGIRFLYEEELTDEGYDVISSFDCENILKLIDKERPDVIILGIMLGAYNGLDLLIEIRNTYYNLPVMLCTAYSDYKYDPRSIAADYFVVKGSNLQELKVKIKMALEGALQIPQSWVNYGYPQVHTLFEDNDQLHEG